MLEIIKEYMEETKALLGTFQENISLLNEIVKTQRESLSTMDSTVRNLNERLKALENK